MIPGALDRRRLVVVVADDDDDEIVEEEDLGLYVDYRVRSVGDDGDGRVSNAAAVAGGGEGVGV